MADAQQTLGSDSIAGDRSFVAGSPDQSQERDSTAGGTSHVAASEQSQERDSTAGGTSDEAGGYDQNREPASTTGGTSDVAGANDQSREGDSTPGRRGVEVSAAEQHGEEAVTADAPDGVASSQEISEEGSSEGNDEAEYRCVTDNIAWKELVPIHLGVLVALVHLGMDVPIQRFEMLRDWMRIFDIPAISDVSSSGEAWYSHMGYLWGFMRSCNNALLAAQLSRISRSRFYSILLDTTTAFGSEEHCLVYIRYVDDSFMPRTEFLCTVKVAGTTAELLCDALVVILSTLGISVDRLVGFCVDGDPSLIAGLRAKLRQCISGHILSIHCAAHRTALMTHGVLGSSPELLKLDKGLSAVHVFFSGLPRKYAKQWVRCAREHLTVAEMHEFPDFKPTSWFSRAECVSVLVPKVLPVLIRFLGTCIEKQEEGWEALLKLREELTDVSFIAILHLVADILQPLDEFRKYLGRHNNVPHGLPGHLQTRLGELRRIRDEGSKWRIQQLYDSLNKSNVWINFVGPTQLHGKLPEDGFRPFASSLASEVEQFLNERFPDTDILSCFEIFDPAFYAYVQSGDLDSLGNQQFKKLLEHYCNPTLQRPLFPVFQNSPYQLFAEFDRMKRHLWECARELKGDIIFPQPPCWVRRKVIPSLFKVWQDIHTFRGPPKFDLIEGFVSVALALPLSALCCKRGFALHNAVKHRVRNRYAVATIDMVMRVKMHEIDPHEFDYDAAVEAYIRGQEQLLIFEKVHINASGIEMPCGNNGYESHEDDMFDLAGVDVELDGKSKRSSLHPSSCISGGDDDDEADADDE